MKRAYDNDEEEICRDDYFEEVVAAHALHETGASADDRAERASVVEGTVTELHQRDCPLKMPIFYVTGFGKIYHPYNENQCIGLLPTDYDGVLKHGSIPCTRQRSASIGIASHIDRSSPQYIHLYEMEKY